MSPATGKRLPGESPGWKYGARQLLHMLISVAVVAGAIGLSGLYERWPRTARGDGRTVCLQWVAAVALGLYVAAVAHEVGHVLSGLLVGFRPVLAIVWPFQIAFSKEGVRCRLARVLTPGLTISAPAGAHRLGRRAAVMAAGGPVAGLVLAGAALYAWRHLPGGTGPAGALANWARLFLPVVGWASGTSAVVSSIPVTGRGAVATDGARVAMLARGGPRARRWCALLAVQGANAAGHRPREWDGAWIAQATSPADGSQDEAAACLAGYLWALDRGDEAAAGDRIARALSVLDRHPWPMRKGYYLEAAFFHARFGRDAVAAQGYLEQVGATFGGLAGRQREARAEAAVLLAQGRLEEAAGRAREGLAQAAEPWSLGQAQAEREWLEDILQEATGGQG